MNGTVASEHYRRLLADTARRYRVLVDETDLLITSLGDFSTEARAAVVSLRAEITAYGETHSGFFTSLTPLLDDAQAPPVVRDMLQAAIRANVGPMAAVAGAVAGHVGRGLLPYSPQVVVENGGDVYLRTDEPQIFCVLAESSEMPLLRISVGETQPGRGMGVCTSSGKLGHSLSFGRADAVTVAAEDVSLADALATAMANRVQSAADIEPVLAAAMDLGAFGALVMVDGKIGARGGIRFV